MTKYYFKKDYSSNLIAKWIFDDTNSSYVNGNTIYDLSGKGNTLTSYNITYKDDIDLGRCAYFNGINAYMTANNSVIPVGKKSIIINYKLSDNNLYQCIINNCNINGHLTDFGCGIQFLGNTTKEMMYTCVQGDIRLGRIFTNITSNVAINNIYTFNKNECKLYENLKLVKNISVNGEENIAPSDKLYISTRPNKDYWFKGWIQSIEIYNEAIEFTANKYLIQDKNNILYTLNGTDLVQASSQILDESNFIDNGVIDTDVITKDLLLSKFENLEEVKLLAYTDDLEKDKCEMIYNCEPFRPIDKLKKNSDICNILFKEV